MSCESLDAALAAGALIVTPNNRLARQVVALHDQRQRQAGLRTWIAARALPWGAFVDMLWQDTGLDGTTTALSPLAPAAATHAWQEIVEAEGLGLLDARGAARHAADAYALFHAYRNPGESWRSWAGSGIADDPATFARWASRYRASLEVRSWFDRAELPDRLAASTARWTDDAPVALLGFVELAPAQQRLVEALTARGARIERIDVARSESIRTHLTYATPTEELVAALEWARAAVESDPGARVGIVVADLGARRVELLALADEILDPARLVPLDPERPAAYGISLGVALAIVPIIAEALDLLALATGELDAMAAAAAMRSPYLAGPPGAWTRRAGVERTWREQGRRSVRALEVAGSIERLDGALAQRLRRALPRGAAVPSEWASAWSAWLDAAGWPGDRSLTSAEWQARDAWQALLVDFARLDDVAARLDAGSAFAALRALAQETVWAPQAAAAPIQVLGVLEASGLAFDHLWLAGFHGHAWPPAPRPNPFLPLAWQRERNVPRASAARELAYARRLTDDFMHAAANVVASHAKEIDGAPQRPSALFAGWPAGVQPVRGVRLRDRVAAATRGRLEPWRDDAGPPLQAGDARGGVSVIESQSTCPFQAFAHYRLDVEGWPAPDEGLTPRERGTLLHFALAGFWDGMKDHATLAALDPAALEVRVAHAVATARSKLPEPRWRALAPAIAAGESQRMMQTIVAWLVGCELPRPPFRILALESNAKLKLGGLTLSFRIDRMDSLADGGVAIIDYKSGRAEPPSAWFRPRPSGTQVGLYTLAQRAAAPTRPVHAVAYAQLKAGEIKACGIAVKSSAWPGLAALDRAMGRPEATWTDVEHHWHQALDALGWEFQRGEARVTPRNRAACSRCDYAPLCRIRNLHDEPGAESAALHDD